MEAGTERFLSFTGISRTRSRRGPGVDHLADAKRESQRGVTEELMRWATDIDPDELERLRARAERKPDRITPEQEVELHDAVRQLAGIRLKGAAEIDVRDPGGHEKLVVTAGSQRGGIQRIAHLSPDHQEMGTSEGMVAVRPVYVPWFREVDGENKEVFRQENTIVPLNDAGEPRGAGQVVFRIPQPDEIARILSLLRDGEMIRCVPYESQAAADPAEA